MSTQQHDDTPETAESPRVPGPAVSPMAVGCGESAGGLQAFSELVAALPDDVAAAFVLVQHLAPEHDSMLPTLLQHQTSLPVTEAVPDTVLERGRVYVSPPGTLLDYRDGRLGVSPRPATHIHRPIDHFLRTLA